ncbi:hypothetical protein [Streptomyces achromogenes]|uniref:hypothetical protein n=1 Tax=Streptomyces achromogenes TaxID=67255 RepID=UPI0004CC329A|nr:hypothetical protein [Streptomyces achromogenes]
MTPRHLLPAAAGVGLFRLPAHADTARDISRDVLAADDGWAAYGTGTTAGAAADDAHVYTVTDRTGLVRALDGGSDTPEIIRIAGTIDADTDDSGRRLDCADYATDGYRLKDHLAAYVPRTRGSARPSGPQEEARQAERVRFTVGSHTTIVGLGRAVLKGASLQVRNADDVIVRNLGLRDAYAMLIGDSDSDSDSDSDTATGDRGRLRVTLHHDQFESVVQADLVKSWNGGAPHASGTLWGSPRTKSGGRCPVDLPALHNDYNSGSERDLTADAGRAPVLHGGIDSAAPADRAVARGAGAGRIR